MDFREAVREHRTANDELSRGDPKRYHAVYSERDDVTLANPFGPAVRGRKKVTDALTFASTQFREGKLIEVETVAEYVGSDLATLLEIEHWKAKVAGRKEALPFVLRVSTTYRREDGTWKLVHRHADPITTFHADGPLRTMGG